MTKRKREEGSPTIMMVLSPAKMMDESPPPKNIPATVPVFAWAETLELVRVCQKQGISQLRKLMSISDALAKLNKKRYKEWDLSPKAEKNLHKQALWLFRGQAFQAVDVLSLETKTVAYLQKHLRILSGIYGILRPGDRIQPYRLMMGTKLKNDKGKDLYTFWGQKISEIIRAEMPDGILLNVASDEYFKAVDLKALGDQIKVVKCTFKEQNGANYKVVSVCAKVARGLFCRYMALNNCQTLESVKKFNFGGYVLNKKLTTSDNLVFSRTKADAEKWKKEHGKKIPAKKSTKKRKKN